MAEMDEDSIYDNNTYETIPVKQNESSTQSFELLTMKSQTVTNELEQAQANVAYGQLTSTSDSPKANCGKSITTRKAKMFVALFLVLLLLAVTVVAIALSVFNTISDETLKGQCESAANTSAISMQLIEETQSIVQELRNDISLLTSQLNDLRNSTSIQLDTLSSATHSNISELEVASTNLQNDLDSIQSTLRYILGYETASNCGPGLWRRVAYLNMSDPSQQCPSVWREYSANGVRACGRSTGGKCISMNYSIPYFYSKVCGRVIGYQVGDTNAFEQSRTIDGTYVDGISITYGSPRQHIWTYASGISEVLINSFETSSCPCSDNGTRVPANPPSFVANNYYCESGNPDNFWRQSIYTDDLLWDGLNCERQCCSDGRNPPWFSVQLTERTTSDIEVRICGNEPIANEDTPIELLELYVQ